MGVARESNTPRARAEMAGPNYAIIFAALVAIAAAAPVAHPDAVVPEQGSFPDTIVPEVEAEKQALLGVNTEAKSKSKFGWLGKITGLDDDPYGYGYSDDASDAATAVDASCFDQLEQDISDKLDAQYTEQLGKYGDYVPYAAKKRIKDEARKKVTEAMEKKGLKGSCKEYADDGSCGGVEVDALCAKTCDACAKAAPAGSGSGLPPLPLPAATGSSAGSQVQELFQDLQIDGVLYKA